MLRGSPFLPKELFRIMQRQRWVIAVSFVLGLVATPFAAGALAERYRSEVALVYGGLIGLVVGLALAVFRESRDLTLASEDEVRRTLSVPVLGVISLMGSQHDRRTRRATRVSRTV